LGGHLAFCKGLLPEGPALQLAECVKKQHMPLLLVYVRGANLSDANMKSVAVNSASLEKLICTART
jgi:hypothetical protein